MNRSSPSRYPLSRVVKFGDTSHGLYSAATGEITTPDDVQIPCPGAQPLGADAFVVRVPGTPPVPAVSPEEAAADAAAGRVWLDYGIISGFNRRLYGAELAAAGTTLQTAWIYIDDAGGRWLVRAYCLDFWTMRLTFRRFGHVEHGQPVGEVVQTVDIAHVLNNVSPAIEPLIQAYGYKYRAVVDAISTGGQRVMFVGGILGYQASGGFGTPAPFAVSSVAVERPFHPDGPSLGSLANEVLISGIPPAATVTPAPALGQVSRGQIPIEFSAWKTPVSNAPIERHDLVTSSGQSVLAVASAGGGTLQAISEVPGTYSGAYQYHWFAGVYYDDSHNKHIVTVDLDCTAERSISIVINSNVVEVVESVSITGTIRLSCAPGMSIPYAQDMLSVRSRALNGTGNEQLTQSWALGAANGSHEGPRIWAPDGDPLRINWVNSNQSWFSTYAGIGGVVVEQYPSDVERGRFPVGCGGGVVMPVRFGSRCWGIVVQGRDGILHLVALASPQQHKILHKSGSSAADLGWACAHPVTGEIIDGPAAHCFV